ncbi:MAG UNVERIFIED_CONTAM: DUF1553 domain-containing protein [Planctomycetaceae bacterium]
MVNRLWRHFLGTGLIEPVDDLRATNPPSNAKLWEYLNDQFVQSDFDLRHVMRLIMNSETYRRSSATLPENQYDQRFHSHAQARRLPGRSAAGCHRSGDGRARTLQRISTGNSGDSGTRSWTGFLFPFDVWSI